MAPSKTFGKHKLHKELVTLHGFIWLSLRIAPKLLSWGGGGRGQETVARPCTAWRSHRQKSQDICLGVARQQLVGCLGAF